MSVRSLLGSAAIVAGLCLLLSACCFAAGAAEFPRVCAEEVPIKVSLSMDRVPLLNTEGILTATVTSDIAVPNVVLEVTMPTGDKVVGSPTVSLGEVAAFVPVTQTLKVKFASPGDKLIRAAVRTEIGPGQSWSSVAYLGVNIGAVRSQLGLAEDSLVGGSGELAPPDGKVIGPAPALIAPVAAPMAFTTSSAGAAPAAEGDPQPAGSLVITGHWSLLDRYGSYVNMKQVLCELLRGDGVHLEYTYTNWNGDFTFPAVTNPGATGCYVQVSTWTNYGDGNFLSVINGSDEWNDRFRWNSPNVVYTDGTHSMGSRYPVGSSAKATWIHDDFIKAYNVPQKLDGTGTDLTGRHVGRWSPTSTDGTYWNGDCHFAAGDADDTPDTILHEMGHSVMGNIYGGYWPPSDCPSPHYFTRASGEHCGWTEGWAHIWHAWTTNDGIRSYPGGGSWDFESATWDTAGWDDGDHVEGRVVGAVWDMMDPTDDGFDTYDGDWIDVWDIMRNVHCDTFADFWAQWKSRGHPKHGAVASIYQCTIDYNTWPTFGGLPNVSTPEDTALSPTVDLWPYASDPESSDSELVYTITGNTNTNCGVWISSGDYIHVDPVANWYGTSTVTISCSDGIRTRYDSFVVTVLSVPDAPLISGVPNRSLLEDGTWNNAIDLWAYTYDPETADSGLTFSITGNTNTNCGVSLDSNRYIDISPTANWTGSSTVTVRAMDPGGLWTSDSFVVTVTATNDLPKISGLPDCNTNEDTPLDNAIDLWAYASDVETPDAELDFSIVANTNTSCGVSIDTNRYIDINPAANWNGYSDVTIRVTDSAGATAQDTFRINVYAVNDPPSISGLPNKLVARNSTNDNLINLRLYATDPEIPAANLAYTITGNTDPQCGVSIDGSDYIDITPALGWTGYSDVTVRATDEGGLFDEDTFRVICATFYDKISQARAHADGTWVAVNGKVTTANFLSFYYIEEPDRTSGIRVTTKSRMAIGNEVTVAGLLDTYAAERLIVPYYQETTNQGLNVDPLGLVHRSMGGESPDKYTLSVPKGATDLYNVGLLVRVTGRVVQYGSNGRFFIDDGSPIVDNVSGIPSIYVERVPTGYLPPLGSYVTITGISGASVLSEYDRGAPFRVLRPRSENDIQVRALKAAYVYYDDQESADSFKGLLEANGVLTEKIYIKNVSRTDWSKYHVILIGSDANVWTGATAEYILGGNCPVIGIGEGGALFMDAVAIPDLYLGWMHSWSGGGAFGGTYVGGDILSYPYVLPYALGDNIGIFTRVGTAYVALYDPDGVTNQMLRQYDNATHYVLASELDRFYQWGFHGNPSIMTTNGRSLFVNLVYSTVR